MQNSGSESGYRPGEWLAAWPSWLWSNANDRAVYLCIGALGANVRICRKSCVSGGCADCSGGPAAERMIIMGSS